MKIISWNVAGRVRKQRNQLEVLKDTGADIIGLQEITHKTLPLWIEGFRKSGYKNIIASLKLKNGNVDYSGPRRYGILVASRWPLESIDQQSLEIPWHERLVSVLVHSPNVYFELHVAYIPPGSSQYSRAFSNHSAAFLKFSRLLT